MFLLIDPSEKDFIHLVLFDKTRIIELREPGKNRELLEAIDRFFGQEKIKKDEIRGIAVVVGAGGFTSTRIATVVASVFGYVRKIPLFSISQEEASNPEQLISRLLEQPVGQYLSATYSGEPNIGNHICRPHSAIMRECHRPRRHALPCRHYCARTQEAVHCRHR